MELGARFWLTLIGGTLAVALGAGLVFVLIGWAWYAWGLVGCFVFFGAILIVFAYLYDRRAQARYRDPGA